VSLDAISAALTDRYLVERELGAGGMARVYLATDLKHQRKVALKVFHEGMAELLGAERFVAEIRLTANLQHPHIVPLFDSGEVDGQPYYVMPFVDGESLRDRLRREGRLPLDEALRLAEDVAAGLSFAHAQGVVHRDVKPENILLKDGEALVADFGVALAVARVGAERITQTGMVVGTMGYMSPEQLSGEGVVDGRADQFALATMVYEMLAGTNPFANGTPSERMARILTQDPPPFASHGVKVLPATEAAIRRALAKSPNERFPSARDFVAACRPSAPPAARGRWPLAVGALAIALAVAIGGGLWRSREKARAVAALPQIRALAAEERYAEAFALAMSASRHLEGDTTLASLLAEVGDELVVTSDPPGGEVFLTRFDSATADDSSDGTRIGTTPLTGHVVARGDHRLVVRLPGYDPARRVTSRFVTSSQGFDPMERRIAVKVALAKTGSVPPETEPIPGGRYTIVGHDIGRGRTADLAPFALDRFEVSNARYAEFVKAGGYRDARFWSASPPGFDRARLVDRTGLPAPRGWVDGEPPAGRASHPVTGVSWHEASAYCAWRGGRLPSLFEWEKGSRDGQVSRLAFVMPWGHYDPRTADVVRANFSGRDTDPVDSHPFAISPYGAYNMAGNVKEWLANRVGDGWGTAGGSYEDPMYLFSQVGSQSGDGLPSLGFRCVRPLGDGRFDVGTEPLPLSAATPSYAPVGDDAFPPLLAHYRYDPRPARPRGTTREETADWVRERTWIDGVGGDSVLAYLYLPKSSRPPYHTLVFIPSSAAFGQSTIPRLAELVVGAQVKGGRALLAPVLEGMVERQQGRRSPPAPNSVAFRDGMVRHATEMRLAMDWAAARPDIDSSRFAYIAISFGAGSRLPFAAVDPRFKAVALLGGGIDERIQPTLPEASNINFAPRIRAPKLMINGRLDEEHPWLTRAKPLWELLREPKELLLVDDAGHAVPTEELTPPTKAFLDRVLGPVTPR
jgi:formylglycine-generating enzyme required for sulfatase activity/tRNA A-37 threonylcarbamoyl transferase component Bud32/dienelactone hydrolase